MIRLAGPIRRAASKDGANMRSASAPLTSPTHSIGLSVLRTGGSFAAMSAVRPPSRPWTSGEENRMSEMLEAGNTAGEIAAELDRIPSAIYGRLQRLYRKRPVRDITRAVRGRPRREDD
jgi:DNA-binding CsgD family transcriptional regulator